MEKGYLELTMQSFLLLTFPGIVDDPFNLLLHTLHSTRTAIRSSLGKSKPDPTSRTEFDDSFILRLQTHSRSQNRTIDLSIKVVCVRILGDELRDLDTGDEVFVGLGHEVVVPRLRARFSTAFEYNKNRI